MPTPGAPDVLQFGFATGLGSIHNVVDGDLATFWAPLADGLDSYLVPPVGDSGLVLPGSPRPAIQFDFGDQVRIPYFKVKVETLGALGWCWLLASNASATSVSDTVQAGDINAGGYYTVAQMNSNSPLETKAKLEPIRARFWRFVFWQTPPAA